jgi:hypothetical protein
MNERLQAPSPAAADADVNRSPELETELSGTYFDETGGTRESVDRALEPDPGERAEAFKRDAADASTSGTGDDLLAEGRRDATRPAETQSPSDARSNEMAFRARQVRTQEAVPEAPAAAEHEARAETQPGRDSFSGLEAEESGEMWLSVDAEDAEHWLGAPVLSVPDVLVEEIAISAREGERVVRVRQRLESGLLVELVEARDPIETRMGQSQLFDEVRTEEEKALPADEAADEAADAEIAVRGAVAAPEETDQLKNILSFASARRDGLLITAQAQLAVDSLRSLLSRLR